MKFFWINCAKHIDRREYMEKQFEKLSPPPEVCFENSEKQNFENERFEGIYISSNEEVMKYFELPSNRDFRTYATDYRPSVFGCLLSHLEIWKKIASSVEDAFVLEDDADLSLLTAKQLSNLPSLFPKTAELVQFFTITSNPAIFNVDLYTSKGGVSLTLPRLIVGKDWATTAYWVSNAYAKKIVAKYWNEKLQKWNLSRYTDKWLVADYFLYLEGECYRLPIIKTNDKLESTMNHVNSSLRTLNILTEKLYYQFQDKRLLF